MIKLFIQSLILLSILISKIGVLAQSEIKIVAEYAPGSNEFKNVLHFQNIDYYKTYITGHDLKSKYLSMVAKEIWNGELTRIDTMLNTKKYGVAGKIGLDTLFLDVIGSKVADVKMKTFMRLPQIGINKVYATINSDDYSLRILGDRLPLKYNDPFPFLAYILPYEKNGWKMYCEVDKDTKDIYDWGKKFNLKHYIIFEMQLMD